MIWRPILEVWQVGEVQETTGYYVGRAVVKPPHPVPSWPGTLIGGALAERLQVRTLVQQVDRRQPRCALSGRIAPEAPHREPGGDDAADDKYEIQLHGNPPSAPEEARRMPDGFDEMMICGGARAGRIFLKTENSPAIAGRDAWPSKLFVKSEIMLDIYVIQKYVAGHPAPSKRGRCAIVT